MMKTCRSPHTTRLTRRVAVCAVLAALLATGTGGASSQAGTLVGSTFPARVVAVLDGDTIDVQRPGTAERIRVRLEGIDSPESGEPFSQVARARTRVLSFDQDVLVEGRDVDPYLRLVARVVVLTGGTRTDVSVALVAEGLACHYRQYSSDPALARAEAGARSAGRGFWARDAQKPACVSRETARPATPPMPLATPSRPGMPAPSNPRPTTDFIGNTRSRVYHAPTCRNAGCPNCTRRFASRPEADAAGFKPAGDCLN